MFIFTKLAEKTFDKMDNAAKVGIIRKLVSIKEWKLPWDFRKLHNFGVATHRLRIGEYRLILQEYKDGYLVLDVGHRQSIYKK